MYALGVKKGQFSKDLMNSSYIQSQGQATNDKIMFLRKVIVMAASGCQLDYI